MACAIFTGQPARVARALDIEQVEWGFDGQVVSERFNLLSVLIANNTAEAFDGRVELRKTVNTLPVDAPVVEAVYLAPHTSRWVQFYPYMKVDWEEWTVEWGPQDAGRKEIPRPRSGRRACVLLQDADVFAAQGGDIKRFPAKLFPVSITATDALAAVVLDHVPRWEEARQRAFLEWMRNGGRVHVIHTARGEYPEFTGPLNVLNAPFDRQRVGLGYVERHSRQRAQLDKTYVEEVLAAGRDAAEVAAAQALTSEVAKKPDEKDPLRDASSFYNIPWEAEGPLLTNLKKMSRPEHSWFFIHLLSLVYLLLVFPGCLLTGRRYGGDYRIVFGILGGLIVMFSLVFLFVGRRGYGERTIVYATAIARATDDGSYDVSGWANAFTVDGGAYNLSHAGTGRIYSTCQTDEAVRGEIHNGAEARLTVDIPPYSSRTFGYRVHSAGPAMTATITALESDVALRQESVTLRDMTRATLPPRAERILTALRIRKGANFPSTFVGVHAIYGRRVYSLVEVADEFEMKSEIGAVASFLNLDQSNAFGAFATDWDDGSQTVEQRFQSLHPALVARSLNIQSQREAVQVSIPEDRVRLLVYAAMPESMYIANDRFSEQQGYVLFCADVFPESSR